MSRGTSTVRTSSATRGGDDRRPLPFSAGEAAAILRMAGPEASYGFLGFDVTLAAPLGLPVPRPDALYTLGGLINIRGLDVQCEALRRLRQALSMELLALVHAVLLSLFGVVVIVLLRLLLKRPALSRTAALFLLVVLFFPYAGHPVGCGER